MRILVIEDEVLIGMDIVAALESAGFGEVEHAVTEAAALRRIEREQWNAVVADANLNDRNIEQIVRSLQRRAVPFVIVTGYDRQSLPAVIGDAPVLGKPFSHSRLVEVVTDLCTRHAAKGVSPSL